MKVHSRAVLAFSAAVLVLSSAPAMAAGHHGRGFHGGGHAWHGSRVGWAPGPFWGGVGLGFGVGALYTYPWYPGYVVVDGPPTVIVEPSAAAASPPEATSARPAPVIYPRNGQSAEQTEVDRQACDRWATTQQSALADSSVFQRAVAACMDGRGYTLR